MSDKALEAIITEILESRAPMGNQRGAAPMTDDGGRRTNAGAPGTAGRPGVTAKRPQRRPRRHPLRTSLRLIFVAVVILCVPLMFLLP